MSAFEDWQSFYTIVGSASGSLIGLQFVMLSLVKDKPSSPEASRAFGSPTIVHFSTALVVAATMRMPWHEAFAPAVVCGIVGLCGVIYGLLVVRRVRRQNEYEPNARDWCFYV